MDTSGGLDILMNSADEMVGYSSSQMQSTLTSQMDKVSKKPTARNVGQLDAVVQAANNQANASANQTSAVGNPGNTATNHENTVTTQEEIAKSLRSKGVYSKKVGGIAEAIVATLNSREPTRLQQSILSSALNSSAVRDTISEFINRRKISTEQPSQNIRENMRPIQETGDSEKLQQNQAPKQRYNEFSEVGVPEQYEEVETAGFSWENGVDAEKVADRHQNDFTLRNNNATMKTINGARITDISSPDAEAHAERYYGLVRKMKTDIARIAQNTGYPEETILQIKSFIFMEKHDLGDPELRRFDPSFAMAQSWLRLIDGTPEPHDLTLLKHEMFEKELMNRGMTQHAAHIEVSKKYNYGKESDDYYAALKEHKNRK